MWYLATFCLTCLLFSCSSLPSLYQSIEDIEGEDAIELKISNEAFQNKKDISINIDVISTK